MGCSVQGLGSGLTCRCGFGLGLGLPGRGGRRRVLSPLQLVPGGALHGEEVDLLGLGLGIGLGLR